MGKLQFYNYNTAMLDMMIKSFGDGFLAVMCRMSQRKSDNPNNIKQMIRRMKEGSKDDYHGLWQLLNLGIEQFTEGSLVDEETRYSHPDASDKYNEIQYRLCNRAFYFNQENFFYEKSENVFAYLTADWLLTCNNTEPDIIPDDKFLKEYHPKEYASWNAHRIEAFRPEYYTVFHDVLLHSENNKTFYKWVIDEFYAMMKDTQQADTIIEHVFGKNKDTGEICTTFAKLKYEPGKREWKTIDKLLQNEQHDSFLKKLFSENPDFLRAYQIFQSRMFAAYILENVRAVLPAYIGDWNKSFWQQIIHAYKDNLSTAQLKTIFLSPDYEEKTTAYKHYIKALFFEEKYKKAVALLDGLDKDCPATAFFKNFAKLRNDELRWKLSAQEIEQTTAACEKHARYAGEFSDFANPTLTDILRLPRV